MVKIPGEQAEVNVPLPDGYFFSDPSEATLDEVLELDKSVNSPDGSWMQEIYWPDSYHERRTYLNVRYPLNDSLVGLGILDAYELPPDTTKSTLRSGELSYMMVHPDHRHMGIGRALILARIKIADSLEIGRLITTLSSTNSLGTFYLEQGFKDMGSGKLERTSRN